MNTMELFAGSRSFSKVAEEFGWNTFTVDWEQYGGIDYITDILKFDYTKIPDNIDVIWSSPPCTTFSVASMGHHWTGGKEAYIPKTENAKIGLQILEKTLEIIEKVNPKYWVIENPRGMMRKMPQLEKYNYYRQTPWYCQYGDERAKPTDIWTNIKWVAKTCKNYKFQNGIIINKHCHHETARRGAKTGTQGVKGAYNRSVVPKELCEELCNCILNKGRTQQRRLDI